MWGSPAELECVALHFSHLFLSHRFPDWEFSRTVQWWKALGAPFAADEVEHAQMRSKMWGEEEDSARAQVVQGAVVVWAALERESEREAACGPWVETLLDEPQLASTPDCLNMTLFALMGFIAAVPQHFVAAWSVERHRVGGDELRPLPVVAPFGPSDAGLTYTRDFKSWSTVTDGIAKAIQMLKLK